MSLQQRAATTDQTAIREAFRRIISAIGEDPAREGLEGTPDRVATLYGELFEGLWQDPLEELTGGFDEGHQEMVVLKGIPFYSMCEHHFLPFYGVANLGYIPKGRIVGVGRLARVVEILARRPQIQERLTSQIADTLVEGLHPMGVGVVIEAEHLCMAMRGTQIGSHVVTSANRGAFRKAGKTRSEFLAFLERR